MSTAIPAPDLCGGAKRGSMTRRQALARWFIAALLTAGVAAVPAAATRADDAKDQLEAHASQIDAHASRTATTPERQRRITDRIASQFNVQPSVVTDLRNRKLGFGGATVALALSQELMMRERGLTREAALRRILGQRERGAGWGLIAHRLEVRLGHVVSDVSKAQSAVEQVSRKPERAEPNVARTEKPRKPAKLDRPAKPERVRR